jgi:pilus assembly protein CpaB
VLAGVMVWSLGTALRPPAPATSPVAVAARDLVPGTSLTAGDVVTVDRLREALPEDAAAGPDSLLGHVVAFPVRAGEPLVARHLLGSALLASLGPGLVATPVRLADESATSVLQPGDLVDVIAASASEVGSRASAGVVASRVRVLVAGPPSTVDGGLLGGTTAPTRDAGLLVLATTSQQAVEIARAGVGARLSVSIRAS